MERLVRLMVRLDQAGSVGAARDDLLAVADYGDADPATQLGRDLKHLGEQGWEITNIAAQGETARYRMVSGDNRLRLALTPAQRAALQRAVLIAERSDLAARLGVVPADLPDGVGTRIAARQPSAALSHALRAVRTRSRIGFSYKGTDRLVHPATVRFQHHGWYLSGVEDDADLHDPTRLKHFAVNRMSATRLDAAGTAHEVAAVGQIPLHPLEWEVDEPVDVVLRADGDYVPDVERWLRSPDTAVPSGPGLVDLTYRVTNRAAFRARVYVLGARVAVVGPDSFRAEVLAELRELAEA